LAVVFLTGVQGACAQTAHPAITVGSPAGGTEISSPVLVRAHNVGCGGERPNYLGYSIDDDRAIIPSESPYDIDVLGQSLSAGVHTLHFRSWTSNGECPATRTTFTVKENADAPSIPSSAISSGDLDAVGKWAGVHDKGTPGSSKGLTIFPATTPLYDNAREFFMTYTHRAGERWSTTFANDPIPTHFVLDLYVYFPNPSEVMNLELDLNQVLSNGDTILMTTQCSGSKNLWEYGITKGGRDTWTTSTLPCNPSTWAANTWHHLQIGEHHDGNGNVTHDYVVLDGVYTPFTNATDFSSKNQHWAKGHINMQFQIEGSSRTSGSATAFVDNMTVYRW
jgi:hypothetical protein